MSVIPNEPVSAHEPFFGQRYFQVSCQWLEEVLFDYRVVLWESVLLGEKIGS